jgi:D-alanyl-D-alanine carboxypeptidase
LTGYFDGELPTLVKSAKFPGILPQDPTFCRECENTSHPLAVLRRYGTIAAVFPRHGSPAGVQSEIQQKLHQELGISAGYGDERNLPRYDEARDLIDVGPNLVGRMQQLTATAALNWQEMVAAAAGDGVRLLIVSGYRSYEYQAELIRKKISAGQTIEEILKVSAAPGYSQHHTGGAVDIATPGSRPLTEEFETSDAFRWLTDHAAKYGFLMTYPRDNAHGFVFEPWHWAL